MNFFLELNKALKEKNFLIFSNAAFVNGNATFGHFSLHNGCLVNAGAYTETRCFSSKEAEDEGDHLRFEKCLSHEGEPSGLDYTIEALEVLNAINDEGDWKISLIILDISRIVSLF